jgi:hypothetical protein
MQQTPPDLLHLPHVRPRFDCETSLSVDEISKRIQSGLDQPDAPCKGRVSSGFISLWLPAEDQHYWSPQLHMTVEESERGSHIRGLYGPRPSVWTLFVFIYAILGFSTVVVAIIGLSQRSLGLSAGILWLVPVLAILFGSIYATSYFGQRLGHEQMDVLHDFLSDSTGLTIQEEYA